MNCVCGAMNESHMMTYDSKLQRPCISIDNMACRMLWIGALLVIDCIDKSSQPKCIMNVREIKLSKLSIGWRELGAQLLPTECLRWHFTHKYDVAMCVCVCV